MHEETYKGYTIRIEQDDAPENPREWDNLGTMACLHNRYNLGDQQDNISSPDELKEFIASLKGVYLPLYLYDHSGITMSTKPFNDRFDSGQVGYIFATDERIKREYGDDPKAYDKATEILQGEVETYDRYLTGEIFWFGTYAPNGNETDSCGGFYSQKEALIEARSEIDALIIQEQSRKAAHVRTIAPFANTLHR